MSANLEVMGLEQLIRQLNNVSQSTEGTFKDTLKDIADDMLNEMKQTTAFQDKTGNLRNSLDVTEIEGSGVNVSLKVGANYARKGNHAHLIEYGTSKMTARPFIAPVYVSKKREVIEKIKQALRRAIGI